MTQVTKASPIWMGAVCVLFLLCAGVPVATNDIPATWVQEIWGKDRKPHAAQLHFFSFSQDMFSFQSHTVLEALNCTAFRTYYLREKLCGNICFQQSCFISADTTFKLRVLTFSLQMWQWQEHSIFQSCVFYLCSFAVFSRDCYLV